MSQRRTLLSRRAFVIGGTTIGVAAIPAVGAIGYIAFQSATGADTFSNVGELSLDVPVEIPPLLEPTIDDHGRRRFELTLQTGETEILRGKTARTWGVNGPFLAPTIRAARGDDVVLAVRNDLPELTTLHWHGMHLPASMDGGPHQPIQPGETWEPHWTIDQPASTLWYHPHPHGETAKHVYRGISGLFLIDDDAGGRVPYEYGVDDVPLIIQDKRLTGDGDLDLEEASFLERLGGHGSFGILGDTILVNGTHNPMFEVTRSPTRFRVLNGSNARFYNLGFADDRPFRVIATENGFVTGDPAGIDRLLLGPGERAEILVEFEPGDDVILRSHEQDLGVHGANGSFIGAGDTLDIIRMRAPGDLAALNTYEHPEGTGAVPEIPDGVTTRAFRLEGHREINGKEMDMNRIDEVVPAGATEIWEVTSNSQPHTFHIHGATFYVLDVDGSEPAVWMRGPKDTVLVSPRHPVRLLVRFREQVDPAVPYMYHCHILRHEDIGMMGQFVVVEPGTEDAVDRVLDSDHDRH
jgi:suppressor of ftsI